VDGGENRGGGSMRLVSDIMGVQYSKKVEKHCSNTQQIIRNLIIF